MQIARKNQRQNRNFSRLLCQSD